MKILAIMLIGGAMMLAGGRAQGNGHSNSFSTAPAPAGQADDNRQETSGKVFLSAKTDKKDALYNCGEKAGFAITAEVSGETAAEGHISVRLTRDGGEVITNLTLGLSNQSVIVAGTLAEPGFLRCNVSYAGTKTNVCAAAGFEPERIKTTAIVPDDFDAFWREGRAELAKIPADVRLAPLEKYSNAKQKCYLISFANLDNTRIYGFLSVPEGLQPPYPGYVTIQPAGKNPCVPNVCDWGAKGVLALQLGIHDYEVGLSPEESKKLYNKINKNGMYMQIGAPDRRRYYFRRVILGIDRALTYLAARPDFDGRHLVMEGSSQGGGLSLIMAGFNPQVTAVAANVPAMCDHAGHMAGRGAGWPALVRGAEEEKSLRLKMSPYFDVVNFARKIKCPSVLSVGFIDTTCPPSSVYSAYNEIKAPKRIFAAPLTKHDAVKPFYVFLNKWIPGQLGMGESVPPAATNPKKQNEDS
ncbi:MAG: acetylxylan esterase [Kiritimatiellae bacterium]|nr:acetylxylan esterase [Kiritimatiellia bacterium]